MERGDEEQSVGCLFEDYRRVIYWKSIVAGYSWFLAVQKGPIPKLCAMHNSHYVYLPTAASDLSNNPILYQENKLKADISFVGIPSAYRVIFLEYLLSQNISLAIAGEGWNVYKGPLSKFIISDRWVNSQEAAQIIKLSSIAINLSFKEPSDDISDIQLSPLIFDILSIGVTLLTEEVPLVHETLTDCHFYTFKNKEEAVEKIHKLLSESYKENLNRQNKRNRMLITQKHTWQKRVEQIIELCS